jgi:hypothetical protein
MTEAHLAMFALGVFAGGMGGAGLYGWWLKAHSALLNEAVRRGTLDQYRTMEDGRRADRYQPGRYAEEGGQA